MAAVVVGLCVSISRMAMPPPFWRLYIHKQMRQRDQDDAPPVLMSFPRGRMKSALVFPLPPRMLLSRGWDGLGGWRVRTPQIFHKSTSPYFTATKWW